MTDKLPRFNATDFYLLETDAGVVKSELRAALAEFLGYTPNDSDIYMNTALALMPYIVQTRALADACAKTTLLSYAIGQNLDRIADATCVVGYIDRLPARQAFLPVEINFSYYLPSPTASSAQSIPWSAEISFNLNGKTYAGSGSGTCEKYTYTTGGVSYYAYYSLKTVYCFCSELGKSGNITRSEATEIGLSDIISQGLSAEVNSSPATPDHLTITAYGAAGGADTESDEEFSERIRTKQIALRIPGSTEYYRDLLTGLYGLRDLHIPKKAYEPRTGHDEDEVFSGAVQVLYLGETPTGAPYFYDPPTPDGTMPLSERMKEILSSNKLVSDKIMLRPASAKESLQRYSVHYSMLVGADAAQVSRVIDAYMAALEHYCYRIGIVINFDDISARLVDAGAFDASVKYGTLDIPNLDLYENEYLSAQSFELIRDADTAPVDVTNPARSIDGSTLIV